MFIYHIPVHVLQVQMDKVNKYQRKIRLPPIYRQLLSSRNPGDPYNNRELRDDDAVSVSRRPWSRVESSKFARCNCWCQREFPSI